jgi:NAD(P)-dependent dehydrogenase (short-subunit alcohol dehydrogenase family)
MSGLLEGKTALITGGARGIGSAAATLFAREGANVAVSDLSGDGAAETVGLINAAGGQAVAITGDVTIAADVERMVATTVATFGRLDCAFNNAGVAPYQVGGAGLNTADWSEESFDRMIAINLKGVWLCMRAEIKHMEANVAAKHGVVGLTKTAGVEYARQGIRVNSVCPGYIETDMTRTVMQARGDEILSMVPYRRMGTAEEIAEMVCWLCSDRASFVTGANYNVDGGYVAH